VATTSAPCPECGLRDVHELTCPSAPVFCELCNARCSKATIRQHLEDECPKRKTAAHLCVLCQQPVGRSPEEAEEHRRSCPKQKVVCEDCGEEVTREDLPTHQQTCANASIELQSRWSLQSTYADTSRDSLSDELSEEPCKECKLTWMHAAGCSLRPVYCELCNERLTASTFRAHECPKAKTKCVYCFKLFPQDLVHAHLQHCVNRLVPCTWCGTQMPADKLDAHNLCCEKRRVQCEFCSADILQVNLYQHQQRCPPPAASALDVRNVTATSAVVTWSWAGLDADFQIVLQLAEEEATKKKIEAKQKEIEGVVNPVMVKVLGKKIEAKNRLEKYCLSMRNTLLEEKVQDKFEGDDKDKIEKAVQEALDWLERNQMAECHEFEAKRKEIEGVVKQKQRGASAKQKDRTRRPETPASHGRCSPSTHGPPGSGRTRWRSTRTSPGACS
jgi:hypothetical protein